jgi:hypothetical protein
VTFADEPSDLDVIRNAVALRSKSLFGAQALAGNAGIGVAALEKFILGARLAPDAMMELTRIIFNGKAEWDPVNQRLIDVVKPATLAHSARA